MKISKSNYFLTIVTTSLVLFFLGLFLIVFLQGRNLVEKLKEHANIVVELENDLIPSEKDKIKDYLLEQKVIISGSLKYVSKEEALVSLKESMDLQFLDEGTGNPLNDMFQFNVKSEFIERNSLAQLKEEWNKKEGVKSVVYQLEFYDDISASLKSASGVMLAFMILFLLISIILIHNTFYFRLNADRVKIKTMELVGADWTFIKRPYLKEAFKVAIYAWIISAVILLLLFIVVLVTIPGTISYVSPVSIILVLFILSIASYVICKVSASILVNRYLKEQVHNIY
jgi:cell division transport system permease protein